MTVTYATGSYSDMSDAVAKLITFAVTTTSVFTDVSDSVTPTQTLPTAPPNTTPTASFSVKCLERNGTYFWLRWSNTYGMFYQLSTSVTSAWAGPTDRTPYDSKLAPAPTGGNYWFFRNNGAIHAVFATTLAGNIVYSHLSLGSMDKAGSWTGGEYMTGSYQPVPSTQANADDYRAGGSAKHLFSAPRNNTTVYTTARLNCGYIKAVYNSRTFAAMDCSHANSTPDASGLNDVLSWNGSPDPHSTSFLYAGNWDNPYIHPDMSPNSYNGRRVSPPIKLLMYLNADDDTFAHMGTVPGIRALSMKDMSAGDTINNDWKVFPLFKQGFTGVNGAYSVSHDYAFAYRFQ